ncbi:SCO family protein [uncultured Microscilla sp.]|uniref:SCO family protein n=1 Tax=uncultured Microscilla sp. TaxID=432653 RepID=UPI0026054DE8|nr:SCO family protein [uncultured Microscilla sp.]
MHTFKTFFGLTLAAAWLVCLNGCQPRQSKNTEEKPLPFYNKSDFTPEWIKKEEPKYQKIHTIAPFRFTNQDSEAVTNETLRGKIYVANFFFTTCGSVCPRMTENLRMIQEAFDASDDVRLVSHTVMPWVDSLPRLRRFVKRKNIDTKMWHLVTGKKEEIYTLARQSYFAEEKPGFAKDANEFLHTEHVILVDKKGRIRGVYNGMVQLEVKRLVQDIKTLRNVG